MAGKYHVDAGIKPAPPRFTPVSKLTAIELEGCLGCLHCVKRESCIYGIYEKRRFDTVELVDTLGSACINCLRCVQECKKNILTRARNPRFDELGDEHWKPGIIQSIWRQAETGSIPVSGTGYGGPFAGPGFDSMWTDMSEIVRPTRDGIHGREYISTVIELGRRPKFLEFDHETPERLVTQPPPFIEIPIPILLETPPCRFASNSTKEAIARAASELGTLAIGSARFAKLDIGQDPTDLETATIVELPDGEDAIDRAEKIKRTHPQAIVSVRVPLEEGAEERSSQLVARGADILRLVGNEQSQGLGSRCSDYATQLVRQVHERLVDDGVREEVTILYSGGIAMPEHVAKIILCGADGVIVDRALLVALECRLCLDCSDRLECPVDLDQAPTDWSVRRIVNLMGAWHAQLIEVLGAMGIREVRRLRGELGRAMFFHDLESESFAPVFGERLATKTDQVPRVPAIAPLPSDRLDQVSPCPSRFRNRLGKYKVVRLSACESNGKCVEVCQYGVFDRTSPPPPLAPRSHLCRGIEHCRALGTCCVDHCPTGAIRVGLDPLWETFGDSRWTADLLFATWIRAETGIAPDSELEAPRRDGNEYSGGFDRIDFQFPAQEQSPPEEIDLRVPLNRRSDGRPDVTIGIPFYGGGMSYGSISAAAMLARARAYEALNSFTCTGEGGYPAELEPYANHVITQVATGLFGVSEETIQRARIVEFKYAQGAKPGLGGHLLGDKVTPEVAKIREAVGGSALFSPFPFHSVYSVEDHKKHVDWIKAINPRALVSVKVSSPSDVDMVAVGSYYAGAHILHVDGSYGGTGAAPDIAKKNIAMPIEYAIPRVHGFLEREGVRDEITLVASGGVRTIWDLAKAIALGADAVVVGTAELVALECTRCGSCESGRGCSRGIATTDTELVTLLASDWGTQRLINLLCSWAADLRGLLRLLGLPSVRHLVGRTDLLSHLDYERKAVR